jgi:hypothetical protein
VPPGTYDIEVVKATETTSKAGNEMIVLNCQIVLPGGRPGPEVSEFLTFTKKAGWKIDLVRAACGMAVVPGETVDVEPKHFEAAKATVEIGEKPGEKNPETMFNTIERWLLPDEAAKASKAPAKLNKMSIPLSAEDNLDEIPF